MRGKALSCKSIDCKRRILTDLNVADIRLINFRHDLLFGQIRNAHDDGRTAVALYGHASYGQRLSYHHAIHWSGNDRLGQISF